MAQAMTKVIDTHVGTDVRVVGLRVRGARAGRDAAAAYIVEKDNEADRGPFANFHAAMMVALDIAVCAEC